MSRNLSIRLALVVVFASLTSGQASAQIFGGFPNYGLYPFGGSAPYMGGYGGGYGYPGSYFPGGGGFGYYTGYYASTFTVPGWSAASRPVTGPDMAQARSTLYPAVALPASSPLLDVSVQSGAKAELVVTVPNSQAIVWIEGAQMSQTGVMRRYMTGRLDLGKDYVYDIAVQWTDSNGQARSARRSVTIHAGDEVPVTFR